MTRIINVKKSRKGIAVNLLYVSLLTLFVVFVIYLIFFEPYTHWIYDSAKALANLLSPKLP